MSLIVASQRIPPVRTIVPVHNREGRFYREADLHRWIRLARILYHAQKVDLLVDGPLPEFFGSLPAFARGIPLQVSIRTTCAAAPPAREVLQELKLHDVMLCPEQSSEYLSEWLDRCREVDLPIRLQRFADEKLPVLEGADASSLRDKGVRSVNFVLSDPFALRTKSVELSDENLARVVDEARELLSAEIEVNLIGFASDGVPEDLESSLVSSRRFFEDHQQYERRSYLLAKRLYGLSPYLAGKAVFAMQMRYTTAPSPVDKVLLKWIFMRHRFVYFWVLFFRKFSRDWRGRKGRPVALRETERAYVDELDPYLEDPAATPVEGESSTWFRQKKHYDAVDARRLEPTVADRELADEARRVMANRPRDQFIDASEYGAFFAFHEPMSNAVRWMSISNSEKLSDVIVCLDRPFTLTVTFAAGFAETIGFAIGKYGRVMCPMEGPQHRLTLHASGDGAYVLLRDDVVMRPVPFERGGFVPIRWTYPVDLCLCLRNIDDHITTQGIDIWYGTDLALPSADDVRYSIVVFCTRFSRRLQAAIQSIAHQENCDLGQVEVLIGYVPGVDTTDDVVDSLRVVFPNLRLVRIPFPEEYVKSKGFVINECVRRAQGEWIVLLDADILLAPTTLSRIGELDSETVFVAPAGRRMLDRETTARVLLNEVAPWTAWDELVEQAQDDRSGEAEGIPIGYCQIVRARCFDEVQYEEYEHFEGADSNFGLAMREKFGREKRLEGTTVLHLDHGGSQWFGTFRHQ